MKLNPFKDNKILLGLCFLGYLALFFIVKDDPFFGDAKSTISRLAYQIYDSNFIIWLYPEGMDPGHPVTFPLLHALLWKCFGKELIVSHILNFSFVFMSLFILFKLDKYYQARGWLLILIAINPVFIAMSASLNTHIVLVAFVLLYHQSYLTSKNYTLMNVSLAMLLLTHNQGMLMVAVLWIAQLLVHRDFKHILFQLPALIPWIFWLIIHKHNTGWFLFPPEYAEFRGVGSAMALFKNALIILWRIADFGLIIIPVLAFLFLKRNKSKEFIYLVLLALGATGAIWLSVKFSIAHRYMIFSWIFLSIPAALCLKQLKPVLKIVLVVIIISGSFWYYPGKQLADANIQYRHYFNIYEQIQDYQELRNMCLYSTPPNESGPVITHLAHSAILKRDPKLLDIRPLSGIEDVKQVSTIMHGNVCGPLPKRFDSAVWTWHYITIKSGPAWVNIYSKEEFDEQLLKAFPKRETTWLERKMMLLKNKYN